MYRKSNPYRVKLLGILLLLVGTMTGAYAADPAPALTLDEILEKHIAARGGREGWQAVHTITQRGTYSAFSKVGPFTLHRARDNNYYLDHILNELRVVVGFDGQLGWWINPMIGGEWPQRISGADLPVLMQKIDFESPFFDPASKGHKVEFLGEGDFEGQQALRLHLVRSDGAEETWYLDPQTFLELGFEATGSDFGTPRPQRTYFDDFREVEGIIIPFYVEAQWYTRLRVLEVESVEINAELDHKLFSMPIPEPMQRLASLTGQWHIAVERQLYPGGPWNETEQEATIESRLRGTVLEERSVDDSGAEVVRQITWDRFKERYRVTQIDDSLALLDVKEGSFDEEGNLMLSNQETTTHLTVGENAVFERNTFSDISAKGFKVETETSQDGGETWSSGLRMTYSRATP
jgi:hypothetical protein